MDARRATLAVLLVLGASPGAGRAEPLANDPALTAALVTVEGEAALRDRLRPLVAGVAATPVPAPMQDPRFLPQRYGQAVRVDRGAGADVLLTSLVLVDGASAIDVSAGTIRAPATLRSRDPDTGLAELDVARSTGLFDALRPATAAPEGACDEGRPAFFLAFAGDRVVLGNTRMGPSAGGSIERLRVVAGRLPEGTPLFDVRGRCLAVAIRPLEGEATLVAPLCPALPPAPAAVPLTLPAGTGGLP